MFYNSRIKDEDLASKINLSPLPPVASVAVCSKAVVLLNIVYSLFIDATIVCGGLVLGLYFVLQYVVSFLVLQSSRWERELVALPLLCFECLVAVIVL